MSGHLLHNITPTGSGGQCKEIFKQVSRKGQKNKETTEMLYRSRKSQKNKETIEMLCRSRKGHKNKETTETLCRLLGSCVAQQKENFKM